jgi:hydroxypyruvate reductase
MNSRRLLLELFDAALRAADGRECVERMLRGFGAPSVELFAIGKAASAMARGAHAALGSRIQRALLITKDGHVDPEVARIAAIEIREAAHPVPDERSLAAGEELVKRLTRRDSDACALFLISGGSSSLVEQLQPGVTLDALRSLNERGLAAGWDIGRLNRERARISRLKQGGVARLLAGRRAHALFVSDVPGDDPDVIGSGLLGRCGGAEDHVMRVIVANIDAATRRVAEHAMASGLVIETRPERFTGEAADVARDFVAALRVTAADGLVWGGESTVTLPARAGRGGRNQHLALAAACLLRADEPLTILAAGTDGSDGPTNDAGALVDAGTVARIGLGGVDAERALREFDSALALEAAQDLVHTGPTGTNVGDILIGLKRPGSRSRDLAPARMI